MSAITGDCGFMMSFQVLARTEWGGAEERGDGGASGCGNGGLEKLALHLSLTMIYSPDITSPVPISCQARLEFLKVICQRVRWFSFVFVVCGRNVGRRSQSVLL